MKLLVADDNTQQAWLLSQALGEKGFSVDVCESGEQALALASAARYHVLLLDWSLPDKDGLAVCAELRRKGDTVPILMLSARNAISEKVFAFESGVDDYLTKPYDLEELFARTRALIRRRDSRCSGVFRFGEVTFEEAGRIVHIGEARIELTSREFSLLRVLAERAGQTLTRAQILELVWGVTETPESNFIDVHVGRLRDKLGVLGGIVQTVRRVGYRFVPPAVPRGLPIEAMPPPVSALPPVKHLSQLRNAVG